MSERIKLKLIEICKNKAKRGLEFTVTTCLNERQPGMSHDALIYCDIAYIIREKRYGEKDRVTRMSEHKRIYPIYDADLPLNPTTGAEYVSWVLEEAFENIPVSSKDKVFDRESVAVNPGKEDALAHYAQRTFYTPSDAAEILRVPTSSLIKNEHHGNNISINDMTALSRKSRNEVIRLAVNYLRAKSLNPPRHFYDEPVKERIISHSKPRELVGAGMKEGDQFLLFDNRHEWAYRD